MKIAFTPFTYIDVAENGDALIYHPPIERGTRYRASLKPKNWIERYSSDGEASELPNIILRRRLLCIKVIFLRENSQNIEFKLVKSALGLFIYSRASNYLARSDAMNLIDEFSAKLADS